MPQHYYIVVDQLNMYILNYLNDIPKQLICFRLYFDQGKHSVDYFKQHNLSYVELKDLK